MPGSWQRSGALAAIRTSGESGAGRIKQNVSVPSGPTAVIVTPLKQGNGGMPEGRRRVTISTAKVPRGPKKAAENVLPAPLVSLTGFPCRFQSS